MTYTLGPNVLTKESVIEKLELVNVLLGMRELLVSVLFVRTSAVSTELAGRRSFWHKRLEELTRSLGMQISM